MIELSKANAALANRIGGQLRPELVEYLRVRVEREIVLLRIERDHAVVESVSRHAILHGPDRRGSLLRNQRVEFLNNRTPFGINAAEILRYSFRFRLHELPNVKDQPRRQLAPKAAPQPTCQLSALAVAPGSAFRLLFDSGKS